MGDPAKFGSVHKERIRQPDHLYLQGFPRYGITTSGISTLVRRKLDEWGAPALVVVDYGAILRPEKPDARHAEIGKIHEQLSSLAQTEQVPLWTPFQSNRQALINEAGAEVRLEHAGDSYEATQHADCIIALCQTKQEENQKRARFNVVKARESVKATVYLNIDWAKSCMEERDPLDADS
jgi:replicative DNA helicase